MCRSKREERHSDLRRCLLQHLNQHLCRQRFEQVHCLLCFALRTLSHTSTSGATTISVFMTTS